jgi:hypothetical protein
MISAKRMTRPIHRATSVKLYIEPRDIWIGLYVGPNNLYFCVFTIVLRIPRRRRFEF